MKSEAIVITMDFGTNYFNAILLNKKLKLISCNGTVITLTALNSLKQDLPDHTLQKLIEFFREINHKDAKEI